MVYRIGDHEAVRYGNYVDVRHLHPQAVGYGLLLMLETSSGWFVGRWTVKQEPEGLIPVGEQDFSGQTGRRMFCERFGAESGDNIQRER